MQPARRVVRRLLILAALGLAARVALLSVSYGTWDVLNWGRVGALTADEGLLRAYNDFDCNQPPGQPLWAALSYRLSRATGGRFELFFKAPLVVCDALVLVLLWRVLAPRRGATAAALAVALYAWSPVSILITAHHGNLDPLYAALGLLAVYLIAEQRRDLA